MAKISWQLRTREEAERWFAEHAEQGERTTPAAPIVPASSTGRLAKSLSNAQPWSSGRSRMPGAASGEPDHREVRVTARSAREHVEGEPEPHDASARASCARRSASGGRIACSTMTRAPHLT